MVGAHSISSLATMPHLACYAASNSLWWFGPSILMLAERIEREVGLGLNETKGKHEVISLGL
uniref:Uncharacterized protein n=1 Tax=Arundo donax TaxID=35708 RepID=A0A0A8YQH4_ARUDO